MSAMTALIFHSASAPTTIESPTRVAVAARRAVLADAAIARGLSPRGEGCKPMSEPAEERIYLDVRRHGVVLVRPLARALGLALLGGLAFLGGWPFSVAGAASLCIAAGWATGAVLPLDRTRVLPPGQH